VLKFSNRFRAFTFIWAVLASGQLYASCFDGIDNDNDGAFDQADPDCSLGGSDEITRDYDRDGLWDGQESANTSRVSVTSGGLQGNNLSSGFIGLSSDGRYAAFSSWASNLVTGDTNNEKDIFVRDRLENKITRVSVTSGGFEVDGDSYSPSISADGRYVAFVSGNRFVVDDTNGTEDIYVHDRQVGSTVRVSVSSAGVQADRWSDSPYISANGRYVAFRSTARNLVAGDRNFQPDIFVHDRQTGVTTRVSEASDGAEGNAFCHASVSISADGRYVAFVCDSSNLVAGDTNGQTDVFVHDRHLSVTARVSLASDGSEGNFSSHSASISSEGRFVAFTSNAHNFVSGDSINPDIFVHDRTDATTKRVSIASDGTPASGSSGWPGISGDGRFVIFNSDANNLVANDNNGAVDVFLHDRSLGKTVRVSAASDGTQGNGDSGFQAINAQGNIVAFGSSATNLVSADSNGTSDIFVRSGFGLNTDAANPDTDGDGLLDGFEVLYGFDPLIAGEEGLDTDIDGLNNLQEQAARTSPHKIDSDNDGVGDLDEINNDRNPAVNEGSINAIIKMMLLQ